MYMCESPIHDVLDKCAFMSLQHSPGAREQYFGFCTLIEYSSIQYALLVTVLHPVIIRNFMNRENNKYKVMYINKSPILKLPKSLSLWQ